MEKLTDINNSISYEEENNCKCPVDRIRFRIDDDALV